MTDHTNDLQRISTDIVEYRATTAQLERERNAMIRRAYLAGVSQAAIARMVGMSQQRIHQICADYREDER